MTIELFDSERACGYTQKTTFYQDFSIAEAFGTTAVKHTCERALREWKTNIQYLTELVMVLNWKCWAKYGKNQLELSSLYGNLYYEARAWVLNNIENPEDLKYFYQTTD